MQKFCRSKERNIKFFKVLFVAGDDVITADGLGAGSHETVLEVLCPSLECSEDIVVGNAAHLDDFQHLPDGLICEVSAVGVFSYQIVDVGNGRRRNKTVNFVFFAELRTLQEFSAKGSLSSNTSMMTFVSHMIFIF